MCDLKSDIGAKAAWKGFASQTVYIAYRLMSLNDDWDFFPEKIEDLMIKKENKIIELVQIKNLSSELALSHLSPKESDSFFRRALNNRAGNDKISLKVISFGRIGPELQGLIDNDKDKIQSIKDKLLEYQYCLDDIEWLLSNVSITQVNEKELKKEIFNKLELKIETMAAPQLAFDTLISYVSHLSRYGKYTSKDKWNNKLDELVKDISSINGLCAQYGKTIIRLSDYKTLKTNDELIKEYREGVNAHPQHIRNGLDILRRDWLQRLQASFEKNNVTILKGASGQGKSSLAFRYLIENYVENYVFVIDRIIDYYQALDIIAALNGLAISKSGDIAVYLDVAAYDTNWLWIAEEINKRGMKIKLLVTIREEDFNRSDIDLNIFNSSIIDLSFVESEAKEIFSEYHSPNFLDFNQAWDKFGETGPFMEFIYLLNQADTLKNKLESQISRIITNEPHADEWLDVLQVICYVGKNNLKLNIETLLTRLSCSQSKKMLQQFENEYLLKLSGDRHYVECLHSVRAEILYDIVKSKSLMNEETTLLFSISAVDEFFQVLLVNYFCQNSITDQLIEKIMNYRQVSWTAYASIVSALLWLDMYRFYRRNKEVYEQGNQLFAENFVMLTGDATGYIEFDSEELINNFEIANREFALKLRELISCLPESKIDYFFTDMFLNNLRVEISSSRISITDNLSEVGFVLFWLAQRNIIIEKVLCDEVIENITNFSIDNTLDFMIGLQKQNKKDICEVVAEYLIPIIIQQYRIVRLNITSKHVEADFILNIYEDVKDNANIRMNEKVMNVVDVLRRLFFDKEKYIVKAIGTDIIQNIQIPDTEKHIESTYLPLTWITQMNRWLIKIDNFGRRTENWNDFNELICNDRKSIISYSKTVCDGIGHFYKKQGSLDKFKSKNKDIVAMSKRMYQTPKCINDKYGLILTKNKVKLPDSMLKPNNNKDITSFLNSYKNSFINFVLQKDDLILCQYKREELNEKSRLSVINVVSSVLDLAALQNEYNKIFPITESQINPEDEYEQLLLLAVMWQFLYNNKVRKDNAVEYFCKEVIKQKRKKLKNFFNEMFKKYALSISQTGYKIYVSLNSALVDEFCEDLFLTFKSRFPDMAVLSVDSLFLAEYAKEIIITIPLYENIKVGGLKINLKNLINCQDVENFLFFRQPLDTIDINSFINDSIDEENLLYNVYKVIGNFSSLSIFYNHTTSVIRHIKSYNEDTIIEDSVFYRWCEEGSKLHSSVIQDIINSLQKFNKVIPSELQKSYKIIMSALNDYQLMSEDIVKTDDISQLNKTLTEVSDTIIKLLDNCAIA